MNRALEKSDLQTGLTLLTEAERRAEICANNRLLGATLPVRDLAFHPSGLFVLNKRVTMEELARLTREPAYYDVHGGLFWHKDLLGQFPSEYRLDLVESPKHFGILFQPRTLRLTHLNNGSSQEIETADIKQVIGKFSGMMNVGWSGFLLKEGDQRDAILELAADYSRNNFGFSDESFVRVLDPIRYRGEKVICLRLYPSRGVWRELPDGEWIERQVYDAVVIDEENRLLGRSVSTPLSRSNQILKPKGCPLFFS